MPVKRQTGDPAGAWFPASSFREEWYDGPSFPALAQFRPFAG